MNTPAGAAGNPNSRLTGRQISADSYSALRARLPLRYEQVLNALETHGPQTANQLVNNLPPSPLSNVNVRSRLQELVRIGLVVTTGVVEDPISGRKARQYRLRLPGEPPHTNLSPPKPARKELEAELARLRAENAALKARLDGER